MNENYELLKAAGFSDEFIGHIQNFNSKVPQFLVPAIDANFISYKSIDTTELIIHKTNNSATSSVFINPSQDL